jgi:hypothetical protein
MSCSYTTRSVPSVCQHDIPRSVHERAPAALHAIDATGREFDSVVIDREAECDATR